MGGCIKLERKVSGITEMQILFWAVAGRLKKIMFDKSNLQEFSGHHF